MAVALSLAACNRAITSDPRSRRRTARARARHSLRSPELKLRPCHVWSSAKPQRPSGGRRSKVPSVHHDSLPSRLDADVPSTASAPREYQPLSVAAHLLRAITIAMSPSLFSEGTFCSLSIAFRPSSPALHSMRKNVRSYKNRGMARLALRGGCRRHRQNNFGCDLPVLPDAEPIDDHQKRLGCSILSSI